ncbi:hypothetical protein CapIbe_019973 [Capra ibex]
MRQKSLELEDITILMNILPPVGMMGLNGLLCSHAFNMGVLFGDDIPQDSDLSLEDHALQLGRRHWPVITALQQHPKARRTLINLTIFTEIQTETVQL